MSASPLGWDYPAGAEHDPSAPYNQDEPEIDHEQEMDDFLNEMVNIIRNAKSDDFYDAIPKVIRDKIDELYGEL